ncbi:MAG: molecular chaperone DnaJ [Deltaproteobacteria bacterium]|nr:molecular chaperone DnaJ [Deltaproteobacteria bacterium]MBM4293603.1 molecular chaperone DnaJ [Deltaproteobacteria bacterium]
MTAADYYHILGISPEAPWTEIRRRYRVLARKYHPDRNPGNSDAAAHFRQVAEAYEAIQEIKARIGAHPRPEAQKYRRPRDFHQEAFFEEIFGIPRTGAPLVDSPGADFRYDLQIPFAAAIRGMETAIQVFHTSHCSPCRSTGLAPGAGYQTCPHCQGRGRMLGGPGLLRFGPICEGCRGRGKIAVQVCFHCHGQGSWGETRRYHLSIPPGTRDGARLRIVGEGGAGFQNGPPGNLEVVIHVEPHHFFSRVGNDLHCRVQVSFAQAALGGPVRVPTLDGFSIFNLPRGTQNRQVFRFPGAGAPGGDQVMEVVVVTPESLNPRQTEILQEMLSLEQESLMGRP